MKNKKVWCVFNPNGRAPFCSHDSLQSAKTEAKRLALNNPEIMFYVMESMGVAVKNEVSFTEHFDYDLPF